MYTYIYRGSLCSALSPDSISYIYKTLLCQLLGDVLSRKEILPLYIIIWDADLVGESLLVFFTNLFIIFINTDEFRFSKSLTLSFHIPLPHTLVIEYLYLISFGQD